MPFPKNRGELDAARYRFNRNDQCKRCRASIEWWITPLGRDIPMNPMLSPGDAAVSHFGTCPFAQDFRRDKRKGAAA